jgi:hypothetical protein
MKKKYHKYHLSNARRSLWKNNREYMESIRQKAIIVAKKRKDEKNENLKNYMIQLPEEMTTEELKNKLNPLEYSNDKRKFKIESLIKRLKRKSIIKFDYSKFKWIVIK